MLRGSLYFKTVIREGEEDGGVAYGVTLLRCTGEEDHKSWARLGEPAGALESNGFTRSGCYIANKLRDDYSVALLVGLVEERLDDEQGK